MGYFGISLHQMGTIIITTITVYFFIILVIKINGLRTLSKMSGHDVIVTLAIGSICAATISSKEPTLLQGALSIVTLLAIQSAYSIWRVYRRKNRMENEPLLLMKGSKILEANLIKARVTKRDIFAKLREANVFNLDEVQAVIFEQTGDISVLHGEGELSPDILDGVRKQ